ncbi:hypothetical protein RhiirA5_419951 [Rhizophagus irregularis]|uniref:Uncharacterized protein n=1 Tax=Rhizophagus irregularis TaxID=588596 RepID=A0A2N0R9D5_9GLOM|nr:hypothetical protein RhiirA5_419951 [Rhizophagus irregularis]PKC59917.1 hypothetical protein RhiirA1_468755 [Rhizophagus irregularis]
MRIFSAQLFKLYTFFLVAIATVVLGVPLVRRKGIHGSFMCPEQNALIKRVDIPFEERCPEEYSYISSICSIDEPNLMLINCARETTLALPQKKSTGGRHYAELCTVTRTVR